MATYPRSTTATFTQAFLDSTGVPLPPLDPGYPAVEVRDPAGAIVASGVGVATGTPGSWQFSYAVQPDATISPDWRITWTLVDADRDSHEVTTAFKVVPQLEDREGLDRTASYLTMVGSTERLIWKGSVDPEDISVSMTLIDGTVVFSAVKTQLQHLEADCYHHYYTDTPILDANYEGCEFLITWRVRETVLSSYSYQTQTLVVPNQIFWFLLPYLKNLIDKLNKKTTTPLSYLDSELHKAFTMGLGLFNSIHPFTNIAFNAMPGSFHTWWVFLAGIWALNSRDLLEVEVAHDLSGQTVQLTYDKHSPMSDVISRWQEMIREWVVPAKLAFYRQTAGPGTVAVRPFRISYQYRPMKVSMASPPLSEFPTALGYLGLIPA